MLPTCLVNMSLLHFVELLEDFWLMLHARDTHLNVLWETSRLFDEAFVFLS